MKKHRILVVEDEPRMRANLVTILKMEGYEVIEAKHGKEGVEVARTQRPDFIFCDISMPELDGHGVLKAVRADAATMKTPFVFLTAHGDRPDVRAGMNLGADDYLTKPVEVEELVGAIKSRLNRREQMAPLPKELSPAMLMPLGLTEREAETLFWLAQGKANADLCILLNVQLTTIKKHLEKIYQKLGVENRTAAAAMALETMNAG
ncbi:DNA-binding response regulator [Nibricoccus aquaticus]|uniref:DNA-binding response regulator n=1 Tax=Nibricoccus aquaticus TaxID=2576891 RepID=A0A290QI09_9BACT|nr:response regulator transcription factor [Nibricoccus aquaticus]ATC63991.1 DNA-binding response regulator [Nibricoccus aquaticus]